MEERRCICNKCEKEFPRSEMEFTRDCHGITFRLVCFSCYEKIMGNEPYYDGQYYTELDENIDPDM